MHNIYILSILHMCHHITCCEVTMTLVLLDFLVTVKALPHECVIRTGLP